MSDLAIDEEIIVNIKTPPGEKCCRAIVRGFGLWGVRIEMVDAAPSVDLPSGIQTIVGWDRMPEGHRQPQVPSATEE
jgi:hypothetical protein